MAADPTAGRVQRSIEEAENCWFLRLMSFIRESEKRLMTQTRCLPELLIRDGLFLAHAGWEHTVGSVRQEHRSRLLCYRRYVYDIYDDIYKCQEPEEEHNRFSKSTKIMTTPTRKDYWIIKKKKDLWGRDCGGHIIYLNFHYSVFLFPTACGFFFFFAHFLSCCPPIIFLKQM